MSAELNFPLSLPEDIRARSFEASNSELGVLPGDASAFLDACAADGVKVLGWELWIADHRQELDGPEPSIGNWTGLIPTMDDKHPSVFGGEGDVNETRKQLAAVNWAVIDAKWLGYIRVNFTLG